MIDVKTGKTGGSNHLHRNDEAYGAENRHGECETALPARNEAVCQCRTRELRRTLLIDVAGRRSGFRGSHCGTGNVLRLWYGGPKERLAGRQALPRGGSLRKP